MSGQTEVWWQREGDAYHGRNRGKLTVEKALVDHPLALLRKHGVTAERILDLGCGDGTRTEALRQAFGGFVLGVDVSREAVEAAQTRYPECCFRRTKGHKLPLSDRSVELVHVSFVLHWVAREYLLRTLAEIDRVLQPGGYLVVADFYPPAAMKVPYRHAEGIYTYKQDYGSLVLTTCLYRAVDAVVFNHATNEAGSGWEIPEQELACCWLFQKEEQYREVSDGVL